MRHPEQGMSINAEPTRFAALGAFSVARSPVERLVLSDLGTTNARVLPFQFPGQNLLPRRREKWETEIGGERGVYVGGNPGFRNLFVSFTKA